MNTAVVDYYGEIPILDVMNVKGYSLIINGKQRVFLYAKDIAIGAGLINSFIPNKNYCPQEGNKPQKNTINYWPNVANKVSYIKWKRMNNYAYDSIPSILERDPELQFLIQLPIHEYSYIPQELAYMILMRCNGKKAREFQATLAVNIIPLITNKALEIMKNNQENLIRKLNEEIMYKNTKIYNLNEVIHDNEKEIKALKDGISLGEIENLAMEYHVSPCKIQNILNDLGIYTTY